jgi:hypothetical protein
MNRTFTVTPEMCDIAPKTIAEFQVTFLPGIENAFYGKELECYVYYKSMRSFRLVNELTFTPPWCLTCHVLGNSFVAGGETFLPKIDFHHSARNLNFFGCAVGGSIYRTIRITNSGDTPVKFCFSATETSQNEAESTAQTFTVKPRRGLLARDQSQLIVFRFTPKEAIVYEQVLKAYFNDSSSSQYVSKNRDHLPYNSGRRSS